MSSDETDDDEPGVYNVRKQDWRSTRCWPKSIVDDQWLTSMEITNQALEHEPGNGGQEMHENHFVVHPLVIIKLL